MAEKKAARRSCHYPRQTTPLPRRDGDIIPRDYDRGALIAGLLTAASVGACMLHWAVM